jgi:Nucleopolyhedrovirus late expression factor 3 (LEF-3)
LFIRVLYVLEVGAVTKESIIKSFQACSLFSGVTSTLSALSILQRTMSNNYQATYEEEDIDMSESKLASKRSAIDSDDVVSSSKKKRVGSSVPGSSSNERSNKPVRGQLISKNLISVNNEKFYLFKFLIDNSTKDYYGTKNHYCKLNVNTAYEVHLVYENKRINIQKITECDDTFKEILMVPKIFLTNMDFENEDTVSVVAKLKFGFKMLDNNNYKAVFIIRLGSTAKKATLVQIECNAHFALWSEFIKDASLKDESALLKYFKCNQNEMFNLCRVKAQEKNKFKNLNILHVSKMTKMSVLETTLDEDEENVVNVSRKNKRIIEGELSNIRSDGSNDKYHDIKYKVKDEITWVDSKYFLNNNNADGEEDKVKDDKIKKLRSDINQINDMIEMGIITAFIYSSVNCVGENTMYNVLGIIKIELDNQTYEAL